MNAPRHADQGNGGGVLIGCVAVAFFVFTVSLGVTVYFLAFRSAPPVAAPPPSTYPAPTSATPVPAEPPVSAEPTAPAEASAPEEAPPAPGGDPANEGTIGLESIGRFGGRSDEEATPSESGSVRTESTEVTGSLDREVITRVVRRHINEVRYCYERALSDEPLLSGRLTVSFVISPSGSVSVASIRDSTFPVSSTTAAMNACVASAVRRWVFPTPVGGGIVTVNYPFVLNPG